MVKIVAGGKGSGKTKRMIRMANEAAVDPHGSLFFVDGGKRNIYEINRNIRFINTDDFKINTPDLLYGFLCGIFAGDYDTEKVYLDGIDYIGNLDTPALDEFVDKLEKLADENDVELFLCFTAEDDQLSPANKERMI